jgi:hypothetical protein
LSELQSRADLLRSALPVGDPIEIRPLDGPRRTVNANRRRHRVGHRLIAVADMMRAFGARRKKAKAQEVKTQAALRT